MFPLILLFGAFCLFSSLVDRSRPSPAPRRLSPHRKPFDMDIEKIFAPSGPSPEEKKATALKARMASLKAQHEPFSHYADSAWLTMYAREHKKWLLDNREDILAEAKKLELRVEQPPGEMLLNTNSRALSQIMINLTNNAIKFTESGQIVIRLRRTEQMPTPELELSVSDTGCGIPKEDQLRLFQAFTQIDAGPTRRYEGTGLGLHLSQKLASLLGAWITCESESGRGSRFTLHLPLAN